jgi:tetratricopeptide (TPR) repeat protein
MMLLAISWVAVSLAAWPIAQDPPPAQGPTTIERAEALLQQGQEEAAIETLRAAISRDRKLVDERVLLSRVFAWLGRTEDALTLLREGLGIAATKEDAQLQWEIGSLWKQLGDDGPFFQRRGSQVVYLPADDQIDEGAWRNERYRHALEAFCSVLEARPDLELAYERVGELQAALEEHAAALATWTAAARRFPTSRAVRLGRARASSALGRTKEAIEACDEALQIAPRLAAAHALLADLREQAGEAEAAARAREQARFYAWAPEFLELDFEVAGSLLPRLDPRLDEEASRDAWKLAQAERSAEIERLLATRDAASTKLLAALCYHHADHGSAEERCFAELEARGVEAIPVLRALLEHAQTSCTQKGAAHALAGLRAPGLLETLVAMLPGDVRALHYADIAGALAKLGDRAAVAPLLASADLRRAEAEEDAEDDFFVREGRLGARNRAVLALGVLGGDEARAGLQAGVDRADLGAACRVALYRITREEAMVERLRAAVLADDSLYRDAVIDYLQSFAPELARELAAKVDAEAPEDRK